MGPSDKVILRAPRSLRPALIYMGCAGPTNAIHGDPTSQLAGLEGSAVNVLMPDTFRRVHGSMHQSGFDSMRGTSVILGKCF